MATGNVVIVGGTQGLGPRARTVLRRRRPRRGRDRKRPRPRRGGCERDRRPHPRHRRSTLRNRTGSQIAWRTLGAVDYLVLAAIERDTNTVREYDIDSALRLVTLKLVGYTEVIHTLIPRLGDNSSILIYGGLARDRPYPGSTTVTTVNGGVTSLVRTLVTELAPTRVNALHPAIVGDSPQWRDMPAERREALVQRTPIGRLVTMAGGRDRVALSARKPGDQRHQPGRGRRLDVRLTSTPRRT